MGIGDREPQSCPRREIREKFHYRIFSLRFCERQKYCSRLLTRKISEVRGPLACPRWRLQVGGAPGQRVRCSIFQSKNEPENEISFQSGLTPSWNRTPRSGSSCVGQFCRLNPASRKSMLNEPRSRWSVGF